MGYDLHMAETPDSVDEKELPNSSGVPGYYRFNVWGMGMTVGALEWAGAIYHGEPPPLPELEGIDEDRVHVAVEVVRGGKPPKKKPPTEAELAAARAYLDAHEKAVSKSSLKRGRVGAYKFQSNDGWLVTPKECLVIASKLRASVDVIARDFFGDAGIAEKDGRRWVLGFARYNEIAAEHGGYRVR